MKRVNIYQTVTEALSFAVTKFETNIRIAWLPICLILLFNFAAPFLVYSILFGRSVTASDVPSRYVAEYINRNLNLALQTVPLEAGVTFLVLGIFFAILYASYFTDLFRLAALGEQPSQAAFSLRFGRTHFKFIVASIFGYLVVALAALPFLLGMAELNGFIEQRVQIENYAVFPNEKSLHYAVLDTQTLIPWYSDMLLTSVAVVMLLFIGYVSVRLIPLPFFVAAQTPHRSYNSFKASLAVGQGAGVFKLMLAYVAIVIMIWPIMWAVMHFVLPLIVTTLGVLYTFIGVTARLSTGVAHFPDWVRAIIMAPYLLAYLLLNIVMISFISSILAGFGASIYKQFNPVA